MHIHVRHYICGLKLALIIPMKLDLPEDQNYSVLIGRSLLGPLRSHWLPYVHNVVVKSANKVEGTKDNLLGQDFESGEGDSGRMSEMGCTKNEIFDNRIPHEEFNELLYLTPVIKSHSTDLKFRIV